MTKALKSPVGRFLIESGLQEVVFRLAGVPLFLFGLMYTMGYKTKVSATVLLFLLILITLAAQTGTYELAGGFFKNIALAGILIFFILNDKTLTNKNEGF
ncbi:hypothetical protein [Abyssalbus ytuae]|uniref:Uncharacterized protein n=1 Tax=Abyssalbus ytuae TaxID=2926907 RepID=A0A9E6ZNT2_9FLAO|nr:hypothetical protein [Abyssalbus ytuae]UOB18124.1 hypothetical protein MQE35_02215 [Abyssalbus ytuae]